MAWRNPVTSLPADSITSGNLSGSYDVTGTITLAGNPASSHIQAGGTSLVFYASDGVTPLITMDTSAGAGSINSATITGGLIRTSAAAPNIYLDGNLDAIGFGIGAGIDDGHIYPNSTFSAGVTTPIIQFDSPTDAGSGNPATLQLQGLPSNGIGTSIAELIADRAKVTRGQTGTPFAAQEIWATDNLLLGAGSATQLASGGGADVAGTISWTARGRAPSGVAVFGQLFTGNTIVVGNAKSLAAGGCAVQVCFASRVVPAANAVLNFWYLAWWL